jgi:hypothetical protein
VTERSPPPSPPSKVAMTCVYITRGRDKQLITTWGGLAEARSQIGLALHGEKYKWLDHQTIQSVAGVKVQCHHLEEIMELDDERLLQPQEEKAVLRFLSDAPSTPQPMTRREKRKARVAAMNANAAGAVAPGPTPPPSQSASSPSASSQSTSSSQPHTGAPVQMPIDEVARQLGVHPRQVRRMLRSMRWAKIGIRYIIDANDLPQLRKAIRSAK